jgi:predicted naringenin-chalcone synthase
MYFKQIAVEGMGCLSYIIGCPMAWAACVVDPKRDSLIISILPEKTA